MAVNPKKEEKEPLFKKALKTNSLQNNNNAGVLYAEVECDAECDDDPETIRQTAGVGGETFPHRRLSSVSSQDAYSDYSASNSTTTSEDSDTRSITNGGSKWRFWSNIIMFTISSFLGGLAVSILVPFYTKEAEEKGVTVSQAGLVSNYGYYTNVFLNFCSI